MTTVTPPKSNIPIGHVTIGGQRLDVEQSAEFVRFFNDFFRRVGGTIAPSNTDLDTSLNDLSIAPAGISDTSALDTRLQALEQRPESATAADPEVSQDARIQQLEAEVDRLRQIVEGLQQGTTP